MITSIIVKFRLEGIHNWPAAYEIQPEVDFLSHRHRHIFHLTCKKMVNHDDRDIEIIMFKRQLINFLTQKYGSVDVKDENENIQKFKLDYCDFGSMSCEMIAKELVEEFELISCQILEDGENGAIVELPFQ